MFQQINSLIQAKTRSAYARETSLVSKSVRQAHPSRSLPDVVHMQRAVGNQGILHLANDQATNISPADSSSQSAVNKPTALAITPVLVSQTTSSQIMRLPAEPYVQQINVNLTTPQNVTLDWQGTPPDGIRSTFRCSTGKGYGDPDDPPGICNRACCTLDTNHCASPNDRRSARGSCCTPVGNFVIQSKERDHAVEGGTIPFWMYFYRSRGIALHEYSPVDGTPLSHGCVRLDSVNAEMLFNYSYANVTRVHVEGTATPACPTGSGVACTTSASLTPTKLSEERQQFAGLEKEEVDQPA